MIVAIPFVTSRGNFDELAGSLLDLAGLKSHVLIVTYQPTDEEAATKFFEVVRGLFAKASLIKLPYLMEGAVRVANEHFFTAAKWAAEYVPGSGEIHEPPFLYLDPAFHPIKTNWADELQSLYYTTGAKVVGKTVVLKDSVLGTGSQAQLVEGGAQFAGPVLLDHAFAKRSLLLNYLHPTTSWRYSLRWEMLASHAQVDVFDGVLFDDFSVVERVSGRTIPVANVPVETMSPVGVPEPDPIVLDEIPEDRSEVEENIVKDEVVCDTPEKSAEVEEIRRPTFKTKR